MKLQYDCGPWMDDWVRENEYLSIEHTYFDNPEEAEQFARELERLAAEWRARITARGREILQWLEPKTSEQWKHLAEERCDVVYGLTASGKPWLDRAM